MSGDSSLWWDTSWNPVTGCTRGCTYCWARRMAQRLRGRFGYPADDPFRPTFHPDRLNEPYRWGKPRRVAVCLMGELFEPSLHPDYLPKVFRVMQDTPRHLYMLLTKVPAVMKARLAWLEKLHVWPLSNVWLGVSAENQAAADERIPILLQTPAAHRFVSLEPLLGPVDLEMEWGQGVGDLVLDTTLGTSRLDWVVVGGENGPGARPMNPAWVLSTRDQCWDGGVDFFFKGWGEWAIMGNDPERFRRARGHEFPDGRVVYRVGVKAAGRRLEGRTWDEMPW